jgi:hypothetical protein
MTEAEALFCRRLAELGLGYRFQQGFYLLSVIRKRSFLSLSSA